ncbi:MAG: hypothetical protein J6T96_10765, partial [Bacteroidales bacterium]|nr:hypothetical protein [Bacteroidales bacterium]
FFIEYDATKGRGVYGDVLLAIRDKQGIEYASMPNRVKWYENHLNEIYWSLKIRLYPEERVDLPMNKQIAYLAVTIGHELFIHSAIDTVEMWENGNLQEALENAYQFRGESGDYDHILYVKGKRQRMNQYLAELKKAVSGSGVGVSINDIQQAINEHDNGYKHLKNR